MRIEFICETNKDYVMINTIDFRLSTREIITVDRDTTEYSIKDGRLDMTWRGCYVWDGEHAYYPFGDDDLLKGAEVVSVDLEDDADEDYYVTVLDWGVW